MPVALYRKYRPATFAEVVGQEHVTEPLCTSLDSGRINHAYLFSGPRGCGKTSSARILARSLNCVEGPTSTPCGVCDSCVALAPGGPGTLDVTELDAATHNGVDDMRELRDRAFYAPAESRYRVFIIDEAHMISTAGFNALLKIVEEPPEHLIFIFATTEPEKLLQTIRSRTHNYPFRLLTPPAMRGLLERVCGEEGVVVEDAVYPLVIRAGGGSPRDSLSVMDQLLAGAGPEGVTYRRAVALLGVTDSALIDRAVDALADVDQAGLFSVISDVIDAGHDPRRFASDLLDRFRDLLVVQAVPDAFDTGLVDAPVDQREALARQAEELGTATLTRCAALVNEGLMQMRGATAPRLLLEILCARMVLPAAGMTVEALAQRVEALESGQRVAGPAGTAGPVSGDAPLAGNGRRYVRKSQRKAGDAAPEAPEAPVAEPPAEAAAPAEQPVDAVVEVAAPEPATAPVEPATAPAEPVAEPRPAPVAAEQVVESAPVDDGMTDAERAREIMRRRRRPHPEPQVASAPVPEHRPVQVPEPAAEPVAPEQPVQETPVAESETSVAQWSAILEALRDSDLSAWIAARDATPSAGTPDGDGRAVIILHHHTGAFANFINDPVHAAAYSAAAEKVTGSPVVVHAVVGSPGKADAAVPPVQRPQEPPQRHQPPSPPVSGAAPVTESVAPSHDRDGQRTPDARLSAGTPSAVAQTAAAGSSPEQMSEDSSGELTGWRARMARNSHRKQQAASAADGGFHGVPLPEEPGEPWDDDPGIPGGPAPEAQRPYDVASEAAEALAQLDDPESRTLDHRSALEIAGELLENHLGAERTR